MYYHVNGELVEESAALVSVRDRGFLYGDGVFETLRAYNGSIFKWQAHFKRFENSCAYFELPQPFSSTDLYERITETLSANNLDEAYIRLSLTRGIQSGKLTPGTDSSPTIVILVDSLPRGGSQGTRPWSTPATIMLGDTTRIPVSALPAQAKTHNYLNGILARLELRGTDADECLLLDTDGYLTEGATTNLFFVVDDTLCTPSLDGPVLPGITRAVVIELAESLGYPVEQQFYLPEHLHSAEEVFLTNTTWELRPVIKFETTQYATGPVCAQLQRAFNDYIDTEYYS